MSVWRKSLPKFLWFAIRGYLEHPGTRPCLWSRLRDDLDAFHALSPSMMSESDGDDGDDLTNDCEKGTVKRIETVLQQGG